LMVDKITTVPKSKAGERIGRLDDEDVVRLNQAVMVFLGLTVSSRTGRKRQR
jgi:mRNA interferase MazF